MDLSEFEAWNDHCRHSVKPQKRFDCKCGVRIFLRFLPPLRCFSIK